MGNNLLIQYWVKSSLRNFHVCATVVSIAMYVISNLAKSYELKVVSEVLLSIIVVHFLVHKYFYNQHRFITDNMKIYSIPQKKVNKIGIKYVGLFVIFSGALVVGCIKIFNDKFLFYIKTWLMYLLNRIFSGILETDGLGWEEVYSMNQVTLIEGLDKIQAREESVMDKVINYVQLFIIIVGIIALIIVCIRLIAAAIRSININGKMNLVGDKVTIISDDKETNINDNGNKKGKLFDFSPSQTIRRFYKNTIKSKCKKKRLIFSWMTPAEIHDKLAMNEEQYGGMRKLYEKARYSKNGCVKDDVKAMKGYK